MEVFLWAFVKLNGTASLLLKKNPNAFETLNYNLIEGKQHFAWPEWLPVAPLNILDVNQKYKTQLEKLRGQVDLVAGGPPCQGFSMVVKGKG